MKLVIDSYAWIEYFLGSEVGLKFKEYIENPDNEIITNILNIAEISSFFTRMGISQEIYYDLIISNSNIYLFDRDFSKEAGILHTSIRKKIKDFGLIDCFVLLTARKLNAKVLTGDQHFKGFKEAIFLSKDKFID